MKSRLMVKLGLCAVSAALAVMGLAFTWKCPLDCVYGIDSGVFLFKKQLLWNGIGVAACVAAMQVPWRRWLRLAPWGMPAWLVLSVVALFCPLHHGSHRWADLGFVRVNVHLVLVFAWALFSAWLCSKKHVRPWMIFVLLGVLLVGVAVPVLGNANRLARIGAFFGSEGGGGMYAYAQTQMKAAYATAHWFGDADRSLRFLPLSYADAMPSASALLFGKWFPLVAAALFAAFGSLLTWTWFGMKNPSKRMFVFFWGGAMTFCALYSFCQSVGLVPVLGLSPALAGYGGALAVTFWTGLGVVLSMISGEEGVADVSRGKTVFAGCAWAALFAVFAFGAAIASDSDLKFYVPLPRSETFGELGVNAKRGEIRAADGSVLARSVRRRDVYLDPVTAREYRTDSRPESVTNVCLRLRLTTDEFRDLCAIEKNRYVPVRRNVDEETAKWFLSDAGRRLAMGFIVETVQVREYPLGSNVVHVTGKLRRGEDGTMYGSTGLECVHNAVLAGRDGALVRDLGRAEQKALATPVHGGSVTTTVVPSIQDALAGALAEAALSNRAENAWGIVVKIPTGGILAMASETASGYGKGAGGAVFCNNLAGMTFMPAQLMNPLTCAIALNEEVVQKDFVIDQSNGEWRFKGRSLRDHVKNPVTIRDALERRADIAVAKLALEIGKDRMTSYVHRLGFGAKTSEGVFPWESSGGLWDPDTIDEYGISMAGIGGYFLVTPMQIVKAYATLGNHGVEVNPYIVSEVCDAQGVVVRRHVPATEPKRVFSRDVADYVAGIVPGRSATTQMYKDGRFSYVDHVASYVGFYPNVNPEYVTLIGFSKPKGMHKGKDIAFPVFMKMLTAFKMRETEKGKR